LIRKNRCLLPALKGCGLVASSRSATNNESCVANLRCQNYVQFVGTVRLVGITEAVDAVILQIEVAGRRVNGKPRRVAQAGGDAREVRSRDLAAAIGECDPVN